LLRLRPVTDADRDFLVDVYGSTRAEELALVAWADGAKEAFVEQQFSAQDVHYRTHYPGATLDVVELDGERVGRLYVHRGDRDVRIMDIALLPAFRGRGIGERLVRDVFAEARQAGRTVSIHVERQNRAIGLYRRLGFEPVAEEGVYVLLRWTAAAT
jgi:ribosomal protein S18 acetylase RimI-like enzyme